MGNWKELTVGDLCDTISDTYHRNDDEVVLVNTSDVLEGKILNHQTVENKNLKGQFKKTFKKDDILYSEIRPANKRYAYVDFEETERYIASTKLMVLRPKKDLVLPRFLFAFLSSNHVLAELQHLAETRSGTFPQITFSSELAPMPIALPDFETQEKIVGMLSSVEGRIQNNNEINENLEQQARALFQSMFITSEERFSWEGGVFADLIDSTLGGDWGKESPTGNNTEMVYCIRGADIPEVRAGNKGKMPTRYILPKNYAAKRLLPGDIVVEISGGSPTQSTGRVAAISQSLLDRYDKGMVCTNFCKAIKPKAGYSMFIYYYWQYLYDRNVFFLYENGTTGIKNLDLSGFITTEEIVIPPSHLVKRFDDYCQIIFDQIFANGLENEQLAAIRDTLLPRLMSGEIDVSQLSI